MTRHRQLREIKSIRRELRKYSWETGQDVLWLEYDPVSTLTAAVYDEGPTRRYKPPKKVRCLFAFYQEGGPEPGDEGFYTIDHLHLTISVDAFGQAGITTPLTLKEHDKDRVIFEGKPYRVDSFRLRGRVADQYMIITVDATEMKTDDMVLDLPVPAYSCGQLANMSTYSLRSLTCGFLAGITPPPTVYGSEVLWQNQGGHTWTDIENDADNAADV